MEWSAFDCAPPRWRSYVMKINRHLTGHDDTFTADMYKQLETVERLKAFLNTVSTRNGEMSLSTKKSYVSALSTYLNIANINSAPYKVLISDLASQIKHAAPENPVELTHAAVTPTDLQYIINLPKIHFHVKLMSAILLYDYGKKIRLIDACGTRVDIDNGTDNYLNTTTGIWTFYRAYGMPNKITICQELLNVINNGKGHVWLTGTKLTNTNSLSMLFTNTFKYSYMSVYKMLHIDDDISDHSEPATQQKTDMRDEHQSADIAVHPITVQSASDVAPQEAPACGPSTAEIATVLTDATTKSTSQHHYIYLLKEREFINTNENIYKIGRTRQALTKRFYQYPKGSVLMMQISCSDSVQAEKHLLQQFRDKFIPRKDIGSEYFEGDVKQMCDVIYNYNSH